MLACFRELFARARIGLREHQCVTLADEVLLVLLRARLGRDSIREVGFAPPRRCLDGVERGHRTPGGEVLAVLPRIDLHVREREDEVTFARCQFHRRDAHEASLHTIIARRARLEGFEARVLEVIHERRIVLAPDQCDARLELGIITGFDLEAHRESKPTADAAEVIVAGLQHDAFDLLRATEIHLHPFHRILIRRDRAVVAVVRLGIGVRLGTLVCGPINALGQRGILLPGLLFQRSFQRADGSGNGLALLGELGETLYRSVVREVVHIRAIHGGEDCL